MTFWDSLEAIERSDRSRREVRESMIATAGAELASVERFELFFGEELAEVQAEVSSDRDTPLAARFTSFEGPPESIEEGLRTFREDLVDWFRDATSFRGWIALLDAPGGRSVGITFWESRTPWPTSASGASLRNEVAASLHTTVAGVELYEVVMLDIVADDEAD